MDLSGILTNSVWAGLFSAGIAILVTAPPTYLVATFFCGLAGRLVRDLFMAWGTGQNWSTMIAAAVVVLVAVLIIRRRQVSPVVLFCAVLPLGAAVAMFNMIFELMKLSIAKGEALNSASLAFNSNLAKVFVISLCIGLGIAAGIAIVQLFRRKDAVEA